MHIISWKRLREFAAAHPTDASLPTALGNWFADVEAVRWHNFADVKRTYATASIAHGKVVFNVGGNKYRIIARVMYEAGKVYILAVLTHKDYDKNQWAGL